MIFGSLEVLPYLLLAMIPALTFHEWGHALMAKWHGDTTAEQAGRLTLNPLAHLDLFGSIAILLIGFGWAKPVPVDPRQLKGSWAEFWVASAGPIMNLILASIFSLLLISGFANLLPAFEASVVTQVFIYSIFLNVALALFNLIPIGPLDGHAVLKRLLPLRASFQFESWNERYGGHLLFGVILIEMILRTGPLRILVWWPAQAFTSWVGSGIL